MVRRGSGVRVPASALKRNPAPAGFSRAGAMSLRASRRYTIMNSTTQHSNTELDRASFSAGAERYRRELHVHCYRMLGSFEESEDLVQETFLRAWRRRETFE